MYGNYSTAAEFAAATQTQRGHGRFVSGPRAQHQRNIIAITLTRSNPQGEIGFLSDIHCMNVGMAPAHFVIPAPTLSFPAHPVIPAHAGIHGLPVVRRKLLLVGDSSMLCRHPFFEELLAYVKGVGGYRTAHEVAKQS